MKRHIPFLLLSLFLLYSCSSNESRQLDKTFPQTIKLEADKIKINEVIKPVLILVLDDYLVVQNEYIFGEHCFFVYSLESFEFLYSFGRLGQGPKEYIAPRLIQNSKDNILSIFDQNSRAINNFQLTDIEPIFIKENIIEDNRNEPFQELSYINDSIILLLKYDYEICLYSINESRFLDTFSFKENLTETTYSHTLDSYHFSNNNGQIVFGSSFVNDLSVGKIENNKFVIDNKKPSIEFNKNPYKNHLYYLYVKATSNHIFAQYYGYLFMQMQPLPINLGKRSFDFLIEVYDWNLNPLVLLELDSNILRYAVDENRKTIYTWNPLADFDYLLLYKYDF